MGGRGCRGSGLSRVGLIADCGCSQWDARHCGKSIKLINVGGSACRGALLESVSELQRVSASFPGGEHMMTGIQVCRVQREASEQYMCTCNTGIS